MKVPSRRLPLLPVYNKIEGLPMRYASYAIASLPVIVAKYILVRLPMIKELCGLLSAK